MAETPSRTSVTARHGGLRTEYVYVTDAEGNRSKQRQSSYEPRTRVSSGMPSFLGNREVILGSWMVAMALVSWDEWSNHGILPRPLRLWETTGVYAILALVSVADRLAPIATALALGYTLVLLYQFFTGGGGFVQQLGGAVSATVRQVGGQG
jgi:hypothetical protein